MGIKVLFVVDCNKLVFVHYLCDTKENKLVNLCHKTLDSSFHKNVIDTEYNMYNECNEHRCYMRNNVDNKELNNEVNKKVKMMTTKTSTKIMNKREIRAQQRNINKINKIKIKHKIDCLSSGKIRRKINGINNAIKKEKNKGKNRGKSRNKLTGKYVRKTDQIDVKKIDVKKIDVKKIDVKKI